MQRIYFIHNIQVLDVVLNWTYWDEIDKRDNFLLLTNLDKYEPYLIDSMFPAVMELKFADRKTKNFQTSTFELRCNLLTAYRDINVSVINFYFRIGTYIHMHFLENSSNKKLAN